MEEANFCGGNQNKNLTDAQFERAYLPCLRIISSSIIIFLFSLCSRALFIASSEIPLTRKWKSHDDDDYDVFVCAKEAELRLSTL
jgi:hypothetical protein